MKNGNGQHKKDDFVASAQRAFRRVARQLRVENAMLGLPLILGEKNHVRLVPPRLVDYTQKRGQWLGDQSVQSVAARIHARKKTLA